jgi:aspartokinase/homoserine dehydrogenase 1
MRVLKFGGSSLANQDCIKKVSEIVQAAGKKQKIAVVLSAMKGVTDLLINSAREAERGEAGYKERLQQLIDKHNTALQALIESKSLVKVTPQFTRLYEELSDILHGVWLIRECSLRSLDLIMSFGERLSCAVFNAYLNSLGIKAVMVDTRETIVTDDNYGSALVLPESFEKTHARLKALDGIPVITGFIAATKDNVTTTLGRNGSDYTASLIGAALKAECIEIWTDVDGVLSADPRYLDNAFVLPEISYQEAMELSYFGAKVIHPYTMIPAVKENIPILIKNTFNPTAPGTWIVKQAKGVNTAISGIACIEDIAMVNVEGGGMLGVPGIAARIFSALAKVRVNIIMISQASSEHSICLVLKQIEVPKAVQALQQELAMELETNQISDFEISKDVVIISIIGENMRGTPGISGKLFSSLGMEKINVLAIAQGSSERNLSFITEGKDKLRAVKAIHKAFLEIKGK